MGAASRAWLVKGFTYLHLPCLLYGSLEAPGVSHLPSWPLRPNVEGIEAVLRNGDSPAISEVEVEAPTLPMRILHVIPGNGALAKRCDERQSLGRDFGVSSRGGGCQVPEDENPENYQDGP